MGVLFNICEYLFNSDENEENENEQLVNELSESHVLEIQYKFQIMSTTVDADAKIKLYKDIIKLDNTREENILEYLKFLQDISESNQRYKNLFISELEKYDVCISDNNYNKYFFKFPKRKNAISKILDFIEMIKNGHDLDNSSDRSAKLKFLESFELLIEKEKKIDFIPNKKLTWEKKEIYLYTLYMSLINTMANFIDFYWDDKLQIQDVSKLKEYNDYETQLKEEKDSKKKEKIKKIMKTIVFIEGNFFKKYLKNYRYFLENLDNNFKIRFGNFELKKKNDQLLFEDYIQFISCYLFDGGENDLIIYWKETFVSLTKKEKEELFIKLLELNPNIKNKISFINDGKTLKKIDSSDETIEINDLDKYCFFLITKSFINDIKDNNDKEWYLEKYLKPIYYENNLFVYKNDIWKNILINVLKSKAYADVCYTFFNKKIVNFFSVKAIISDILNEIRFFSYNTQFNGVTNNYNYRIYINGIYNYNKNISVSLVIYYGFLIVIGIHEIGGHLNMMYQNFFILDGNFDSPRICDNEKIYYSEYGLSRQKESGETLEIRLFGRKVNELTINEALYILNIKNYKQNLKSFLYNFKKCNLMKRSDLIDNSLEQILIGLSIDIKSIMNEKNIAFPMMHSLKENRSFMFNGRSLHHPIQFYFQDKKNFTIKKLIDNIKEL